MNYNTVKQPLTKYKNFVIKWLTGGRVKQWLLLKKAITAYEKSQVTSSWLSDYFRQLDRM